jgi:hypothetical protein
MNPTKYIIGPLLLFSIGYIGSPFTKETMSIPADYTSIHPSVLIISKRVRVATAVLSNVA